MKSILASSLLILALQGVPGTGTAATDEANALTTADLLAQAQDPAVSGSAADPAAAPAQASAAAPASEGGFPPDQLEQLVAPVALYPDALLMQILMASTYPLEIVEADRWISGQPDLKGEALDKALMEKDWDPSVKSLTTLPDVLKRMSENLDWTQDLGDAFLEQEDQLLDTVQVMRGKAYEAGNLQTSEQQVVTQQPDKIIVIESPSPEVIYVPTYSSTVVYGSTWGYPSYYYPPMYPYYPPGYGLVSFGVGMAVGAAIWGDCNWGWGGSDVNIDIDRHNEFNRNTNIDADRTNINRGEGGRGDKAGWNHDSSHRKGVNYKDSQTAQKFGAGSGSNRVTKDQARGRTSTGAAGGRQSTGTAQTRDRAAGQTARTPQSNSVGGSRSNRAATGQANRSTSQANRSAASQSSRGNSAYSGSRSPSADRMSSSRGASSRGASSYGGSRGGGARAGGGRRR